MEIIFYVFGELLLQLVVEALVELGLHSVKEPFKRPPNPWVAALGYLILGAILGALTLVIMPDHLMPVGMWRVLNLLLSPILLGLIMAAIGTWRLRRKQTVFRIDKFSYGYLFALALAMVRFWFAN
jgi:hypothetical protein